MYSFLIALERATSHPQLILLDLITFKIIFLIILINNIRLIKRPWEMLYLFCTMLCRKSEIDVNFINNILEKNSSTISGAIYPKLVCEIGILLNDAL